MFMRSRFVRRLPMWMVALFLIAVAGPGSGATTKLRLSSYINETDVRYKSFEFFADQVKEKTDGRVEVELFCCSTLHPYNKAIDAILTGITDISFVVAGAIDERLPCARLAHSYPTAFDWESVIPMTEEQNELFKEEFAKVGMVIVMSQNAGYGQQFFFRKPVKSLDELNGMIVRTPGGVYMDVTRNFGGKPINIPAPEVYQAAERGVFDAMDMGIATVSGFDLWEVVPHLIASYIYFNNVPYAMNKKKFDSLSPADQATILEAGRDTFRWLIPRYEAYVNENIGKAVMKKDATARSVTLAERKRLIEIASKGMDEKLEKACGPDMAGKMRALFEKYRD